MQVTIDKFEIKAETEMTEEHPKTYKKIHPIYEFTGNNLNKSKNKIEKTVNLFQKKYCRVSTLLEKALEITYEIKIF